MSRLRWPLVLEIGITSLLLGFLLRDVVYEIVVVPLAYALWVVQLYYSAIPQWILWTVLLLLLFLDVFWNLVPEARGRVRMTPPRKQPQGQVETLAVWIAKSRTGNYFKWQLANRLGKIARRLDERAGSSGREPSPDPAVEGYLDAGLNYSFIDFPKSRNRFGQAPGTPLDVDPNKVAEYLESQMERTNGQRG